MWGQKASRRSTSPGPSLLLLLLLTFNDSASFAAGVDALACSSC